MILQILIHIQRIQIFGIKACQQHIHYNRNVNLVLMCIVLIGVLLALDAFLHILIVSIKLSCRMVCTILFVIIINDGHECSLFLVWLFLIVYTLLLQILLNLHDVPVPFSRWREHTSNVQWLEGFIFLLLLYLHLLEQLVIFYSLIDRTRCKECIEATLVGGIIMFLQDSPDNSLFLCNASNIIVLIGLKVVHMETQHVFIINGVSDSIGMQFFLKHIFCGLILGLLTSYLCIGCILLKDGRSRKTKQLRVWEKLFNGLVVLTKLRTMALVKDEHHTHIFYRKQTLLIVGTILRI